MHPRLNGARCSSKRGAPLRPRLLGRDAPTGGSECERETEARFPGDVAGRELTCEGRPERIGHVLRAREAFGAGALVPAAQKVSVARCARGHCVRTAGAAPPPPRLPSPAVQLRRRVTSREPLGTRLLGVWREPGTWNQVVTGERGDTLTTWCHGPVRQRQVALRRGRGSRKTAWTCVCASAYAGWPS